MSLKGKSTSFLIATAFYLVTVIVAQVTAEDDSYICPTVVCTKAPEGLSCNKTTIRSPILLKRIGKFKNCCPAWRCMEEDGTYSTYFGMSGADNLSNVSMTSTDITQGATGLLTEALTATKFEHDKCGEAMTVCPIPDENVGCAVTMSNEALQFKPKGELDHCCPTYNCSRSDGSYHLHYFMKGGNKPTEASLIAEEKGTPQKDGEKCPNIACAPKPIHESNGPKCEPTIDSDSSTIKALGPFRECCNMWKCSYVDGAHYTHFELQAPSFWVAETSFNSDQTTSQVVAPNINSTAIKKPKPKGGQVRGLVADGDEVEVPEATTEATTTEAETEASTTEAETEASTTEAVTESSTTEAVTESVTEASSDEVMKTTTTTTRKPKASRSPKRKKSKSKRPKSRTKVTMVQLMGVKMNDNNKTMPSTQTNNTNTNTTAGSTLAGQMGSPEKSQQNDPQPASTADVQQPQIEQPQQMGQGQRGMDPPQQMGQRNFQMSQSQNMGPGNFQMSQSQHMEQGNFQMSQSQQMPEMPGMNMQRSMMMHQPFPMGPPAGVPMGPPMGAPMGPPMGMMMPPPMFG